jgi:hypothetical protein
MAKTRIYTLHDSGGEIRYVGKTVNHISSRLSDHIYEATHGMHKDHCGNWLRKCLSEGYRPHVRLQEEVDGNGAWEEIYWIWFYRKIGCNLTNITSGGEGNPGRIVSAETRLKQRLAKLGKKRSKESCEHQSRIRKGIPCSPEHRAAIKASKQNISAETREKMRQYRLGRKMSDEQKEKLRRVNLGKTLSTTTKSKISIGLMGTHKKPTWLHTREAREKARIANTGRKRTQEFREAMRTIQLGRKNSPEAIEKRRQTMLRKKMERM